MMLSNSVVVVAAALLLSRHVAVDSFAAPPRCLPRCLPPPQQQQRASSSCLFGITEWRDTYFDYPGSADTRPLGAAEAMGVMPPKEICILPFPFQEVLLQGETKQLRLYEDRFIQLFNTAMSDHGGVVAMGLWANAGIIQAVPICEIEAYNRVDGFGIFVTIRVVGRAKLLEIVQQEPHVKAVCVEMTDALPPNLELPNMVASKIENFMVTLSSMEHQLAAQAINESTTADADDDDDDDMERRINLARLEDRFYGEDLSDDAEVSGSLDEDDDEEEEEDDIDLDRRGRFRQAYQVALETDTQGYQFAGEINERTPQELTAVSWAAFCTELLREDHAILRLQALDSENLFDRLKLAYVMLLHKQDRLKEKLDKAGIAFKEKEIDDDPSRFYKEDEEEDLGL